MVGFVSSPKSVPCLVSRVHSGFCSEGEKWSSWLISHGKLRQPGNKYIKAQHTLDLPHFQRDSQFCVHIVHHAPKSPAFCSKPLQQGLALIWLLARWGKFSPGRGIPCRNIRNGKISGSPKLVFSLWEWKWAKLFRDSKSDIFKSFCPQSPASMIPWIRDVVDTSQAVESIYEPHVPNTA